VCATASTRLFQKLLRMFLKAFASRQPGEVPQQRLVAVVDILKA
jgi:hypothetical protein